MRASCSRTSSCRRSSTTSRRRCATSRVRAEALLRVREFVMKDAYSFDRDDEGLDVSFRKHFERVQPDVRALRARDVRGAGGVGDDGRRRVDRLPRAGGLGREHARHVRAGRLRRRPRDRARHPAGARSFRRRSTRRRRSRRRASGRSRALAEFLGIDAAATSKAMPVVRDGAVVLALVRGDDRLEEAKLAAVLGGDVRLATEDEIRSAFGADPGSLGPGRLRRRGRRRRGAPRGPVRRRCEPDRLASPRRRARARLRGPLRGHPAVAGGRHLPAVRRPARLSDGDRGWPHLQVGHQVLGGARSDLPRRERQGAAHRHGLVRHRSRSRDGGRGRAAPRRARDRLAARRSRRTTSTS